jgi:SpoVK/Ycf46/Vps4 family AAA+-type ATPase
VSLPELEARVVMLRKHLEDRADSSVDYLLVFVVVLSFRIPNITMQLAGRTEGFSGADIELLCREAAMMPVRRLMAKLKALPTEPSDGSSRRGPYAGSGVRSLVSVPDVDALIKSDNVTNADILLALETTRPSFDGNIARCVLS